MSVSVVPSDALSTTRREMIELSARSGSDGAVHGKGTQTLCRAVSDVLSIEAVIILIGLGGVFRLH